MNNLCLTRPSKILLFCKAELSGYQTAAAHSHDSTGAERITPVLKLLLWPSVCQRIDFKILLLVYDTQNGLGPEYIFDLLLCYRPSRPLWSSRHGLFIVLRVKIKHGEAAFRFMQNISGSNYSEVCSPLCHSFKSKLKTSSVHSNSFFSSFLLTLVLSQAICKAL